MRREYSRLDDPTQLIDESQWRGDDFFIVWPLATETFLSPTVAAYLQTADLQTSVIRPLEISSDLDYPLPSWFWSGFVVGSVEERFPADLAQKYRRPPDII